MLSDSIFADFSVNGAANAARSMRSPMSSRRFSGGSGDGGCDGTRSVAVRLKERDERILRHVSRYRVSVPDVLMRLFFAGQTEEAMKSTLKRLRRKESALLASAKLYARGNEVYYHLTPAGAASVGSSEKTAHALTDHEQLVRAFGQLLFCCGGEVLRPKFSAEEFDRAFPGMRVEGSPLARRFPYDAFFLDVDDIGTRRLGRVLIDNGGAEVLFRARAAVREDDEVLRQFVAEGRYTIAILVATESKAEQVRRQAATRPLGEARPVRCVVEWHEALAGLLTAGA